MNEAAVKGAVRFRDGFRCVKCGMTNDQHKAKYGRGLQVHRKEPGSVYTIDGCVTLCVPCHAPEPRKWRGKYRPRLKGRKVIRMELGEKEVITADTAAHQCGLSLAAFCRIAIAMVSRTRQAVTLDDVRKEGERQLAST